MKISTFFFLLLILASCNNSNTSPSATLRNTVHKNFNIQSKVIEIGSKTHFTDSCSFYFECDCCFSHLLFNKDSSFYFIEYCMSDKTVRSGSYRIFDEELVLYFSAHQRSRYYNQESDTDSTIQAYYIENETVEEDTLIFDLGRCHNKLQLSRNNNNTIGIESNIKYYHHLNALREDGLIEATNDEQILVRYCLDSLCEIGSPTGYINLLGDTVIPHRQFYYCYTDTVTSFGIVLDSLGKAIAIDNFGNYLHQIYWIDNGPDYFSEGMVRIIKDGKIGFANHKGKIIIKPKFACAQAFKNGKAKVSYNCTLSKTGEHEAMNSKSWFYINPLGDSLAD